MHVLQAIDHLLSLGAKTVVLTSTDHETKPDVLVLHAKKQNGKNKYDELACELFAGL